MIKDEHVSRYIGILSNRMRRAMDGQAFHGQYSAAEGRALHFILYHEDKDIFQKDLEEEFGLRAPSASILVKKMEDDGLITRASVSYDGRLKKIIPSEKARTYHDQVVSDVESLESSLVEGISKEEQQQWLAITKKMIENLKK